MEKAPTNAKIGVFARQNIEIITIANDISDARCVCILWPEHINASPFTPLMLGIYLTSLQKQQRFMKLKF